MAVAVSLTVREGVCREVRVALAGACPQPRRLAEVEAVLEGQAPTADYRGSAAYRRAMAGVLVRRAVEAIVESIELKVCC